MAIEKNICTVSFYKEVALFFEEIFPSNKNVHHLSLYPNAYHSLDVESETNKVFVPAAVRKFKGPRSDFRNEFNLQTDAHYSAQLADRFKLGSRKNLGLIANRYLDFWNDFLSQHKIEMIFCTGDTRLPIETLKFVAKKLDIHIVHFEQGPFKTCIWDTKGVNANSSFKFEPGIHAPTNAKNLVDQHFKNSKTRTNRSKARTFKQHFQDIRTALWLTPPKPLKSFFYPEMQTGLFLNLNSKKQTKAISSRNSSRPYILFPLQVPHDAQIVCHSSKYFDDFNLALHDLIKGCPSTHDIVVREHPLNRGLYQSELYKTIAKHQNVFLENHEPLETHIQNSSLVTVFNSTVGLESIALGKKVILLGEAFYSDPNICWTINKRSDLKKVLLGALATELDSEKITSFFYQLFETYLTPGHYTNVEHSSNEKIQSLLNEI